MELTIEFDSKKDLGNFDDDLSEKAVEKLKTVNEFKILEKFKIFIFFDRRLPILSDRYNARIYPTDYPSIYHFVDDLGYISFKDRILSNGYDFVVHIQRKLKEEDNEILKIIDLAHEFQHIIQYAHNLEIFCLSDILFQASKIIEEVSLEYPDPLEVEARKVSKKVAYEIYGQDRVDNFAQEFLGNPDEVENFWDNFISLDINTTCEPTKEIEGTWTQYRPVIEEEVLKINNKLNVSKEERILKDRFEFYSTRIQKA